MRVENNDRCFSKFCNCKPWRNLILEEPACQLQCANGLQLPRRNQTCAGRFKYQLQENHNQPNRVSRRRRKRADRLIKAGYLLCVKGWVIFKFSSGDVNMLEPFILFLSLLYNFNVIEDNDADTSNAPKQGFVLWTNVDNNHIHT